MQIQNTQVSYEDADEELKALYDDIFSTLEVENLPNWASYLGHKPSILEGIWKLYIGIVIEGSLPPLLQELIIFAVSREQGSNYCTEFHAATILNIAPKLAYQDIINIIDGNSRGFVPDRYFSAINVARKLNSSPCPMPNEGIISINENEFSLEEHMEIAGLVTLAIAFNMHAKTAKIPIDESHRVTGFEFP